jgi:shikimate dehydrogenase
MSIKESKKLFGLLGRNLSHSFSQRYFQTKFQEQQLQYAYKNFELASIDEFPKLAKEFNLSGLNVTIPYKESVLKYLDELEDEAKEVGAVNTIAFREGKKIGYNTDVFGFRQMIKPFLLSKHERALILGNGGAAKAVRHVLKNIGLEVITAARNPKKGEFQLAEVNDMMIKHCRVLVNATPVGTFPDVESCLEIPFWAITDEHLVVDLIYNPEQTKFLHSAQKQGATILNGLTMLYQQAEKSWEIWNQKE